MTKFNKILCKKTEKQLIVEFIRLFKSYIAKKEKLNQKFSFVLTGGSSPKNLYKSLSNSKINWKNIYLFWGDERFVSKRSANSNFRLVKKNLLDKIDISRKNIFYVDTKKIDSYTSAKNYENKIKRFFKNKKVSFDLILLGMGSDGHIASLFPDNLNLKTNKIVSHVLRKDFQRITLNLNVINRAKKIFLWLNTKTKSNTYRKLKNNKKLPVNYINKDKTNLFLIN